MTYSDQRNSTSGFIEKGGSDQFDARRHEFRTLHERGCFLIPNPWDIGSARYLQHLGFPALATTSAGIASVGPALARAAWTGFVRGTQALKSDGSFAGFAALASFADINDFPAADLRTRRMRGCDPSNNS